MMISPDMLFVASILIVHFTHNALALSSLVFISRNNYRLNGHVIKARHSRGKMQCAHSCLATPICGGYNYRQFDSQQGKCELVGSLNMKAEDFKLSGKQGWICGRMMSEDTKFVFTHLNAKGLNGPQSTAKYDGTSLAGQVKLDQGIQLWTALQTGSYVIEAWGASGGNGTNSTLPRIWRRGGLGARIKGVFFLSRGQSLKILVGQRGGTVKTFSQNPGSGGGGTFVTLPDNTPLVVAGGGGGGSPPNLGSLDGDDGQVTENGSCSGGVGGDGGRRVAPSGKTLGAGAGGGIRGNGQGHMLVSGGSSFITGGLGGNNVPEATGNGGFGGGGAANSDPGGGGGYSGGGVMAKSSNYLRAGGGGSYNGGTIKDNQAGFRKGNGRVIIRILPE